MKIRRTPPLRHMPALAALSHDMGLAADDRSSAPISDAQGMFPNSPAQLREDPWPIPLIRPLAQVVNSVFKASAWHPLNPLANRV